MTAPNEGTILAHLLRPQGRRGEVLAELLTDFPEQLTERPRLFLAPVAFAGDVQTLAPVKVVAFWLPKGKNEGRIVLELSGVTTIEEAEALVGFDVVTPRADRLPLGPDESYIGDLVGCLLCDQGRPIGTVEDVQFAMSSDGRRRLSEAAPLLVVPTPSGEDLLVPFVKSFLISLDLAEKRIDMRLPAGLLQLNAAAASDPDETEEER